MSARRPAASPARPLSPAGRRGEEPLLPARLYPFSGWRGAGLGVSGRSGARGRDLPREGAESQGQQPHLLKSAPLGQPLLPGSARARQPPDRPRTGPGSPLG